MEIAASLATQIRASALWAQAAPSPSPSDDTTKEVVQDTINIGALALGAGAGVVIGLVVAFLIMQIAKILSRGHRIVRMILGHVRLPLYFFAATWGAHLGLQFAVEGMDLQHVTWTDKVDHLLVIVSIVAMTWLLAAAAQTLEDIANHGENTSARVRTQTQLIRRVIQVAVIIMGIVAIAMTFPAARTALTSVLASAGVASIVATLAAQSLLANVFAGFQLALSDGLRVGDVVVVRGLDGPKVQGTAEEITLTYVVVKVWDGRRIVIPTSNFTQNPFENLTRTRTEMLGSVELYLDYRAPITHIRAQLDQLLSGSDLWDGAEANVQVTDMSEGTMTVRVVVSAKDVGNAWDLSCYLREGLIRWIVREAPYALPRSRYQELDIREVESDLSDQQVAELAEELANITGPGLGRGHTRQDSDDSAHVLTGRAAIAALEERKDTPSRDAHDSYQGPHDHEPRDHESRGRGANDAASSNDESEESHKGDEGDSLRPWQMDRERARNASHQARLAAAKRRARQAVKRRSLLQPSTGETRTMVMSHRPHNAAKDAADDRAVHGDLAPSTSKDDTKDRVEDTPGSAAPITPKSSGPATSDRLYSGTPSAERRGRMFQGPGEDTWAQRREREKREREKDTTDTTDSAENDS